MNLDQQLTNATSVIVAMGTTYGFRIVGAIFILFVGWILSRLLHAGIVRLCARSKRIDQTVGFFLANGARYAVLVFTFIAVLTTFGIETTSFVAVVGAMGLAIGLALQGTLSNLAAGIMLVVFRPFHIGDRIEAGGIIGTTREVNLFYSELDTDDNVRVIFPNGLLWGAVVKVTSRNDMERVQLRFTRPQSDDIGIVLKRLGEIVKQDKRIDRIGQIGVESVADSNYTVVMRLWVPRGDALQLQFDLNKAVKEEFQRRPPTIEEATKAAT